MHSIRKWIASKISNNHHSDNSSEDGGSYQFAATLFSGASSSTSRSRDRQNILSDISRGAQTILQFYYSDDELNLIASELESFDGRRDPLRCTELVAQLRFAQDKVMQLLFQLMDEWNCERASRDYRLKFPEDLLNDSENGESFNGQIWFSAECLASGSDIMNHEEESNMLRPLAKVLTNNLDQIRILLRQSTVDIDNKIQFYRDLIQRMEHFDRLFTAFEFEYVKAMLPIKTADDIEKQQELTVLFSEALQNALKRLLIKQDDVDDCNPSVMISLPRLAIIHGLIYCSGESPIYRKHKHQLSAVLKSYHSVLHRIRDMLLSLRPMEVLILERMLANEESVDNVDFSQLETQMNEKSRSPSPLLSNQQSQKKSEQTNAVVILRNSVSNELKKDNRRNSAPAVFYQQERFKYDTYTHSTTIAGKDLIQFSDDDRDRQVNGHCLALDEVDFPFWKRKKKSVKSSQSAQCLASKQRSSLSSIVDQPPQPVVSLVQRTTNGQSSIAHNGPGGAIIAPTTSRQSANHIANQNRTVRSQTTTLFISADSDENADDEDSDCDEDERTLADSYAEADDEEDTEDDQESLEGKPGEISNKNQVSSTETTSSVATSSHTTNSSTESFDVHPKRLSPKIKSNITRNDSATKYTLALSKQLLHKLFVSIAGIADQLQSNFASDLRQILKIVFQLHTSAADEIDTSVVEEAEEAVELAGNKTGMGATASNFNNNPVNGRYDELLQNSENLQLLFTTTLNALDNINPAIGCDQPEVIGNDSESSAERSAHSGSREAVYLESSSERQHHGLTMMSSVSVGGVGEGHRAQSNFSEQHLDENERNQMAQSSPPIWVPDELVSECTACNIQFTLLRRRHHCRNCGFIFCNNCSNHFVELAHFGYSKPVRVCNECYEG